MFQELNFVAQKQLYKIVQSQNTTSDEKFISITAVSEQKFKQTIGPDGYLS